jgi:hypothetical protein
VFVSQVKEFRALYAKVIVDKHEDVMSKFGAILAQGIIDAGEISFIVLTPGQLTALLVAKACFLIIKNISKLLVRGVEFSVEM